jgi:glycosyltransferase involved in cell wall biosynthesis
MQQQSISVITICFNNPNDLAETIQSVNGQTVLPYEHIIVDGSTNNEIKDFLAKLPTAAYRKAIHERDKGIADAFNKGVLASTGSIIVMLNSGDTLYSQNVLKTVTQIFETDPNLQWLHGKYELNRGGQWVIIGKPFEPSKLYRGMRSLCHQTMYVKKALHNKYGLYNLEEKIGMDYDFVCRIANEKMFFTTEVLAKYAPGGNSQIHFYKSLTDAKRIYEKYNPKTWKLKAWHLRLRILNFLLQSKIGKYLYKIKTALKLENW